MLLPAMRIAGRGQPGAVTSTLRISRSTDDEGLDKEEQFAAFQTEERKIQAYPCRSISEVIASRTPGRVQFRSGPKKYDMPFIKVSRSGGSEFTNALMASIKILDAKRSKSCGLVELVKERDQSKRTYP
jgi:hypothetical protein